MPAHRVILDTDIGTDVDDTYALAVLAGAEDVHLHGVTTVYGDTLLRARIAARLLRLLRASCPVVPGAGTPLSGADIWLAGHEGEGFDDLESEAVDGSTDAVDFLIDETKKHPGELEIVAIGPLTNIATAVRRDPGFPRRVKRLWMMGGRFDGRAEAEHNFRCDSHAASVVFASEMAITVAGVDLTRTIRLYDDDLTVIGASGPFGMLLERDTRAWMARWRESFEVPHDAVAVLAMLRPELFDLEPALVAVDGAGLSRAAGRSDSSVSVLRDADRPTVQREIASRVAMASAHGEAVAASDSAVWVVGSLNEDLTVTVDRSPQPGETVLASSVSRTAGGKGGNQAVAAARAGARTTMVGAVGHDGAGGRLLQALADCGVETRSVARANSPTGLALITLSTDGENSIVVVPGANEAVTRDRVSDVLTGVAPGDVVVAQGEIPAAAIVAAAACARRAGACFVLNLAPVVELALDEVLPDVLILNEKEAELLDGGGGASVADRGTRLRTRFGGAVVITLGSRGAVIANEAGTSHADALPAQRVVDTTGAGDAFVGALAAALASGKSLPDAVAWGLAAGSVAVGARGAQGGLATEALIRRALQERDLS